MINKKLLFKKRPHGLPDENTWELTEEKLPDLLEGEILIEHEYISLDPAMRGWMNEARSYIKPIEIDDVMRAGSVGKVIKKSGKTRFNIGDHVSGWGGVQTHCISNGENLIKVDPLKSNLSTYLGVLGMPGMTAYFGILEEAKIKEGDVVLVSGAAGAVGSLVGQIAKIKGCTVIGIAGGEKKCNYIKDNLGFDNSIDYKKGNVIKEIKKKCPNGIDVYFDNVGGDTLDAALTLMNKFGRIPVCGLISMYNDWSSTGPKMYRNILMKTLTVTGFLVSDFADQFEECLQILGQWVAEGKIKYKVDVVEGIENAPTAVNKLFTGENQGKLVIQTSREP